MKRRVLIVALAVLLAILGTVGVLAYVRQADARAVAGMKAVSVLVAQQRIPSGTSAGAALSSGELASQTLPASSVPADAVRSLAGLNGLVTSSDIEPGQVLLRPVLVTPAQVTGGLAVPAGMVAGTVQLCLPEAVAGNLHAGSLVAVYDTQATVASSTGSTFTAQPNCSGTHEQQLFPVAHTKVVLPQAQVLSVGPAGSGQQSGSGATGALASSGSSSSPATSQNTMLVTMAVSPADAGKLILLAEAGLPYLALLK